MMPHVHILATTTLKLSTIAYRADLGRVLACTCAMAMPGSFTKPHPHFTFYIDVDHSHTTGRRGDMSANMQ
jgi:hypothetical protein